MEKRTLRQHLSRLVRCFYTYFYLKSLKGMDIGKNCSVAKSATMERAYPKSIHIGDNSRISIEATKDIPDHCLVAGNPAKIVRVGIELNDHYQIINHGTKPEKNN